MGYSNLLSTPGAASGELWTVWGHSGTKEMPRKPAESSGGSLKYLRVLTAWCRRELGLLGLAGEGSTAKMWSKMSGPGDFQNLTGQGHEQSDLTLKVALGRDQEDESEVFPPFCEFMKVKDKM